MSAPDVSAYDAFISYAHGADEPLARAVQHSLQTIGKRWYRRRALRVFRDDTNLEAAPSLWNAVEKALYQSRFLVLFASSRAADSGWVAREVEWWLRAKSVQTLLIVLTEGELSWDQESNDFHQSSASPLPSVLRGQFPTEPKWLDLRAYREMLSPHGHEFAARCAALAATIHGLPKDALLSLEIQEQRRALRLAWSAIAIFVVLGGAAAWGWREAVAQRDRAEKTLAAATTGANELVLNVAVRLRSLVGVPLDLVRAILTQARSLQRQLSRYNGDDLELRRTEAMVLRESSQTLLVQGDGDDALLDASASKELVEQLLRTDPTNPALRRDLSLSYNRFGEALAQSGRKMEALEAFQCSLAIRTGLAAERRGEDSKESLRDLALSLERVGDQIYDLGRVQEAEESYRHSLEIRERLAIEAPTNRTYQSDLAVSYDRMGRIFAQHPERALEAYHKGLSIRQALLAYDPRSWPLRREIASSLDNIGDILLGTGKVVDAVTSYATSLSLREELAAGTPDATQLQVNVAISLVKLAQANDNPRARYTRALEILRVLESRKQLTADQEPWTKEIESRLSNLER